MSRDKIASPLWIYCNAIHTRSIIFPLEKSTIQRNYKEEMIIYISKISYKEICVLERFEFNKKNSCAYKFQLDIRFL